MDLKVPQASLPTVLRQLDGPDGLRAKQAAAFPATPGQGPWARRLSPEEAARLRGAPGPAIGMPSGAAETRETEASPSGAPCKARQGAG